MGWVALIQRCCLACLEARWAVVVWVVEEGDRSSVLIVERRGVIRLVALGGGHEAVGFHSRWSGSGQPLVPYLLILEASARFAQLALWRRCTNGEVFGAQLCISGALNNICITLLGLQSLLRFASVNAIIIPCLTHRDRHSSAFVQFAGGIAYKSWLPSTLLRSLTSTNLCRLPISHSALLAYLAAGLTLFPPRPNSQNFLCRIVNVVEAGKEAIRGSSLQPRLGNHRIINHPYT